jgi:hypothetical protein
MATFDEGDRVIFIAGAFKGSQGTYLRPALGLGLAARVKVDGDNKPFRSPRWTSFKKVDRIETPPLPTVLNVPSAASLPVDDLDTIDTIVLELLYLENRMSQLRIRLQKLQSSKSPATRS